MVIIRQTPVWVWATLTALCISIPGASSAPTYVVRELDAPGATSVTPYAVNNGGTIAGSVTTTSGGLNATFWRGGSAISLNRPGVRASVAYAINGAGSVAGSVYDEAGEFRAAIWTHSRVVELTDRPSVAMGLSNDSTAVGWAIGDDGQPRAFHWRRGVAQWIAGPASAALAVNDRGQVAGYARCSEGIHAFLWEERKGRQPFERSGIAKDSLTDLGTLGGEVSHAVSLNNNGQVVGWSQTAEGDVNAFLWERGAMKALPGLGGTFSRANAISASGKVVGVASGPDGLHRAVIWSDGKVTDLNTLLPTGSAWSLWGAVAISDSNIIIGYGAYDGWPCSFVLSTR